MKYSTIIFSILLSLVLCSCKGDSSKSSQNKSGNRFGGQIIIGVSNDVETLNPIFCESNLSQEIAHLMLLGLADLDENSQFKPELAESWENSDDYLKLTYHLRKDAKWSDGQPVTSEDVKFTYDLLMDTLTASPRQGACDYIKNVAIIDSYTVTFEFTEAYPTQLFDTAGEILPKHILGNINHKEVRNNEFGRMPLGSGPFKLKKWVSQQYLELEPNEAYFGRHSYLDKVIFKIIPDKSNLLMQLKSGEIDMVSDVPPAEIESLKKENNGLTIYQVDGRVYYYIGYNEKNPLFGDMAIRKALTMALDRNKIINALLYGYGRACVGPFPPMVKWAFNEDVKEIQYNPNAAKDALKKAGWNDHDNDGILDKSGRKFEFTLSCATGNQLKADVAVIVQEQLGKLGIKVNIEMLEWTTFIDQIQSKQFDACVNGWSTPYYVDPTPVFHSSSTDLFNFISYANPKVDRLIEKGRMEMDQQKAAGIWKEFHKIIYEDQPYTFLFWIDQAVAVKDKYKNVTPLALSSVYDLENWYIGSDN